MTPHDFLTGSLAGAVIPGNREYITTGGAVIIALITTLGAVLGPLLLQIRKEVKASTDAGHQAKRAAEAAGALARPTGNGFADEMRDGFARLEARLEQQQDDIRAERMERIVLARALSNFIERNDQ